MPFPFAGFDDEIQIEAGMGGTQNVVRSHLMNSRRQRGDEGFSTVLLTLCLGVMVAMLGLAIDCGRMFITKNELQTFVDASALAAVSRLDGTREGVAAANAMATAGPLSGTKPNGVNFGTGTVLNVTNTYATTFGGTYASYASASFGSTNNYRFIRVTGSADVPLNFLPVLPGISRQYSLTSAATAGQQPKNLVSSGGLLPSPPMPTTQAIQGTLASLRALSTRSNGVTGIRLPVRETRASLRPVHLRRSMALWILAREIVTTTSGPSSAMEAIRTRPQLPPRLPPEMDSAGFQETAAVPSLTRWRTGRRRTLTTIRAVGRNTRLAVLATGAAS